MNNGCRIGECQLAQSSLPQEFLAQWTFCPMDSLSKKKNSSFGN